MLITSEFTNIKKIRLNYNILYMILLNIKAHNIYIDWNGNIIKLLNK
jgi:hypothetical protein